MKATTFIITLFLSTSLFAQNRDFTMAPSQNYERWQNRELPFSRNNTMFDVPKHSLGIDLFPIIHNLFFKEGELFGNAYFNPMSEISYNRRKPFGVFYNLRLGEEKRDVNTFLTFGIRGLYKAGQYEMIPPDIWGYKYNLFWGHKITEKQIGINVGVKWDYVLSKHFELSIGGQLFYDRGIYILDTFLTSTPLHTSGFENYVTTIKRNIFSAGLNTGVIFHLSERFCLETSIFFGPQYNELFASTETKFTVDLSTGDILHNLHRYWSSYKTSLFSFNSTIKIILYYKI
jgi:hypothetical protein